MIPRTSRELVLKWTHEGKTQQQIAALIGCHQTSICRLMRKHTQTGSLDNLPRHGRPTPLTKEILAELKQDFVEKVRSANQKFCSINTKRFSDLLEKKFGRRYTIRHVERILHKIDFSRITPRSQHIKNDPEKVEAFRHEFKKNFKRNTWIMRL